ncbi:MAG: hypothetical protein QMD95_04680 [Candidatus Hodarchaeaceae archaeon]|nr:hypothetical protein [Candidatus Hodarchaeaceae archaeon]
MKKRVIWKPRTAWREKYLITIVIGVRLFCLTPLVSAQQTIEETYGASFNIDGRGDASHQVIVQYPPSSYAD